MIDEQSIKYKNIRNILNFISEKTKYYTYNQDKNDFLKKWADIVYLILTTEMSFIDIDKYITENRPYREANKLDIIKRDFVNTCCKFICLNFFELSLDLIKTKYDDDYEDVDERMFFRMTLYKEGWSIYSIEKYISKYLSKVEIDNFINIDYYEYQYNNLFIKSFGLKRKQTYCKIGRPVLPKELKDKIKIKNKEKIKVRMSNKYTNNNKYEKLKDNLITPEEFDIIQEKLSGYKHIVNKLKFFILD